MELAGETDGFAHKFLSSVDCQYMAAYGEIARILKPMHPGSHVRKDCLDKHNLSVTEAARVLGVDRQTLSNLLNGRSGISPEMALRLEKAFGRPAREWLVRQLDHELAEVMRRADEIRVEPFRASTVEGGV